MNFITDLGSMYPTTRVYRREAGEGKSQFPTYSIKVGNAQREDGTNKAIYKTIKFGKGVELENETDVVIKKSFVSGKVKTYDGKDVIYEHIQVMDFDIVGQEKSELPFETESDDEW